MREKTDRQLAELIRREFERSKDLALEGCYAEAERRYNRARALLTVANLTAQERAGIERVLLLPATACA
ncbi:MAG: hypothetical protein JST11_13700 [Acidobacteria bacterium]|nr:hypothetical protein [Acidobacteriota bacterium]